MNQHEYNAWERRLGFNRHGGLKRSAALLSVSVETVKHLRHGTGAKYAGYLALAMRFLEQESQFMRLAFPVRLVAVEKVDDDHKLSLNVGTYVNLSLLVPKGKLLSGEHILAKPGDLLELQLEVPTNQRELEFPQPPPKES